MGLYLNFRRAITVRKIHHDIGQLVGELLHNLYGLANVICVLRSDRFLALAERLLAALALFGRE